MDGREASGGERRNRPAGGRAEPRSSVVVGRRPVAELLRSGRPVDRLYVAEGAEALGELVELARQQGIPVQRVPRPVLRRLSGTEHHQGVVARTAPVGYVELEDLTAPDARRPGGVDEALPPLILVLDHPTDPQNVGALLRTAEAVAVRGVVLPVRRSAPITPAVERASAGAVRHVRLARVSSVADALLRLKKAGFWAVGAEPEARQSLWEADLTGPVAVVIGSEGEGMSELVRRRCDLLVRIPMFGAVASLNASVAGALMLYEVRRRQFKGREMAGSP